MIDLQNGVLLEGASSTDRSVLIQSLLSSASTNASGDLVLNLDAYLTADARAANHHALITIKQVSANDGQLSTQNFVLNDTSWSPTLWHDNLNPLVMS